LKEEIIHGKIPENTGRALEHYTTPADVN